MTILSKDEATPLLKGETPDSVVAALTTHLRLAGGTYSSPTTSTAQIALSRLVSYLLHDNFPLCLYVTGWSIAPSAELLDVFYGYRRSLGENRSLIEAPVHVFERVEEGPLVNILSIVLLFSWDASIFDLAQTALFTTSHDGWLEFRASEPALAKRAAAEFADYRIPLLGGLLR